jgi:hypothetical protein
MRSDTYRTIGAINACLHLVARSISYPSIGTFNQPSRSSGCRGLTGNDLDFHEDQLLITAIDDVVLDTGGPEVCYAGGKLGN